MNLALAKETLRTLEHHIFKGFRVNSTLSYRAFHGYPSFSPVVEGNLCQVGQEVRVKLTLDS